ncbi:MAG: (d)CMP kinase [Candidatus Pacebacteria bacterium]|nr:(d)CMP kinase [Candidatus Paceibacterota bacterium]PIR63682.1 MAG: cytidylate kinase [Candidatus Pacebacteria bacterium CG10_big_fil_rev_8_21_14_0_10_40_26]PIZ79685.1 MAG: cytidylate kinase [Candidatus Pacebacteria bacterium CG_4_10_14_0_2_um_filter_40_20]PJA68329.1 MAG: cytidylate kinase [Candidatus Pacebacteria bacterium CG_4_9_14_3_um_filter_40_12]PJC41191.1 MAG: cytidylate kinase [Candidatus Pacebacteria bacterium CG_4_9_14_0_2_um_filter_40_15]
MSTPHFQIAIDGPVAAGKGTISRLVADQLGFLYVDTGAMYRVATLLVMRAGTDFNNENAIVKLVRSSNIQMRNPKAYEKDGRLTTVLVDGEDVSWDIRTEKISAKVSIVAAHPKVREILVEKQQIIAESQDVVMEGRDITYRVLPDANLKIYLTGSDTVRAKRRHLQSLQHGEFVTYKEVFDLLKIRDTNDMERVNDPLKIVDDAWVIDTSDLKIQQVVRLIVDKVHVMMDM